MTSSHWLCVFSYFGFYILIPPHPGWFCCYLSLRPKGLPEENQSYFRFCWIGAWQVAVGFLSFFLLNLNPPQKWLITLIETLNTTKIEENSGLYVIYCTDISREIDPLTIPVQRCLWWSRYDETAVATSYCVIGTIWRVMWTLPS